MHIEYYPHQDKDHKDPVQITVDDENLSEVLRKIPKRIVLITLRGDKEERVRVSDINRIAMVDNDLHTRICMQNCTVMFDEALRVKAEIIFSACHFVGVKQAHIAGMIVPSYVFADGIVRTEQCTFDGPTIAIHIYCPYMDLWALGGIAYAWVDEKTTLDMKGWGSSGSVTIRAHPQYYSSVLTNDGRFAFARYNDPIRQMAFPLYTNGRCSNVVVTYNPPHQQEPAQCYLAIDWIIIDMLRVDDTVYMQSMKNQVIEHIGNGRDNPHMLCDHLFSMASLFFAMGSVFHTERE